MAGEKGGAEFVLLDVHAEMVVPELRHHLAQLRGRVNGADQGCRDNLLGGAGAFAVVHALIPVDAVQQIGGVVKPVVRGCAKGQAVQIQGRRGCCGQRRPGQDRGGKSAKRQL